MLDFMAIAERTVKRDGIETIEIRPKFKIRPSQDLMVQGQDFYAVWDETNGMWSRDENTVVTLIDQALDAYTKEHADRFGIRPVHVLHMWDAETGMIDKWHNYVKKQLRDSYHMLDEKLVFQNTVVKKEDYASKRLPYPLEPGETPAWDKLIGTLYEEKERHKIEWCLGAVVNGASKKLQKFVVIYGEPGSGKSTLLDIIDKKLFPGYCDGVDSQALGSAGNAFAMESFSSNPLIAIQHEGKLSKIEDNTRLNSLVSHDKMPVNVKHKNIYTNAFKCFLILSTNEPVKITDAKSGLLRRLIDVNPSGNRLPFDEYTRLNRQIDFELGPICMKCKAVYEADPHYYDKYMPIHMLGATNDFYNFVEYSSMFFKKQEYVTLKGAWMQYVSWCEYAKVRYPLQQTPFKEELKNYFDEFFERKMVNGIRERNIYVGFKEDKFFAAEEEEKAEPEVLPYPEWLKMTPHERSLLDDILADMPAQYPTKEGRLERKWVNCKTTLKNIDVHRVHHVQIPQQMIVIDLDIPVDGKKNLQRNLEEASKWPATYAELSKSGQGIHLHYWYTGDVKALAETYDEHVEIKTLLGGESLRRCLTECNDIEIATISSGLPLKEVKKTTDLKQIQSEKGLRDLIQRNLNKEIHPSTTQSMNFIQKILDDAYDSKMTYDVRDMYNAIVSFASHSHHQADYCIKVAAKLELCSEDILGNEDRADRALEACDRFKGDTPLTVFDCEVFPNLFVVCYKQLEDFTPDDCEGDTSEERWKNFMKRLKASHKPVIKLINPDPVTIEQLTRLHLIGFNNLRYDNHILYGRIMGYSNQQLFMLSKRIISGDRNSLFGESKNLSFTDVYDLASAGNKMSLKKLEILMDPVVITEDSAYARSFHQELGLDWNKPVPKEYYDKVAEYCANDVLATEAAFRYLKPDWTAREILADIAEMTVNDTTNRLTTKIVFDRVRRPQAEFQYRKLGEPVRELTDDILRFLNEACPEMMAERHGEANSLLPYFDGYEFGPAKQPTEEELILQMENDSGRTVARPRGYVSTYRDETVGEGGYVYAEEGVWRNVALLDIASMHPHSIIAECLFGPRFTRRFKEIVDGRVDIKHEAWDEVNKILDGKLGKYIDRVKNGEMSSKDLANALKTAINSVYGLTSAAFENAFRDPRNVDNIVAKRGALFMVDLKHAVQERGYTVAHIKTDSIKIPNADVGIISFVQEFGKRYGYTFEHEATYEKMCLVNDAVYIAKYATAERCEQLYGPGVIPGDNKKKGGTWTATGKQFAVPYVFKTLFSKEDILFEDMCETFSVTTSLSLDFNETLPDVEDLEKQMAKRLKACKCSWAEWRDIREAVTSGDDCTRWLNLDAYKAREELMRLEEDISRGHDRHFVGRVGLFTPVVAGCGGGLLQRDSDGQYTFPPGAKGYRWCESACVGAFRMIADDGTKIFGMKDIDRGFYNKLVADAEAAIRKYGKDADDFFE